LTDDNASVILNVDEDEYRWRTLENGSRVLLAPGGEIKAGMGGKFTGQNISEAFSKGAESESKENSPQSTAEEITSRDYDNASIYTTSAYSEINSDLRAERNLKNRNQSAVDSLDKIIDNSPNLVEGTILYRGTSTSVFGLPDDANIKNMSAREFNQIRDRLIGGTYDDRAFTSTTTDSTVLSTFTGGNGVTNRGVEMRITCGGNARGASTAEFSVYGARESEVVLPRNSQMRITSVTRSMGRIIISCEYGD